MREIEIQRLSESWVKPVASLHTRLFPKSFPSLLGSDVVAQTFRRSLLDPRQPWLCRIGITHSRKLVGYYIGKRMDAKDRTRVLFDKISLLSTAATRILFSPKLWSYTCRWIVRKILRTRRVETYSSDSQFLLVFIGVEPRYQGSSIAQLLLQDFERLAKGFSAERVTLLVEASNERAIRFYERSGWQITSPGVNYHSLAMHKTIADA